MRVQSAEAQIKVLYFNSKSSFDLFYPMFVFALALGYKETISSLYTHDLYK